MWVEPRVKHHRLPATGFQKQGTANLMLAHSKKKKLIKITFFLSARQLVHRSNQESWLYSFPSDTSQLRSQDIW